MAIWSMAWRDVSIIISAVLAPMAIWWFVSLREPSFEVASNQKKTRFWDDMRTTVKNKTFLLLTGAILRSPWALTS